MGFSFSGAAPNQGLIFTSLKPFDRAQGGRAFAADGAGARLRAARLRSAGRLSSRSRRRRSPASSRVRRLRVPGAGPDRARTSTALAQRHLRRWPARGTSRRSSRGLFSLVHGQRPAAAVCTIDRAARAGARLAAERNDERAADLPRARSMSTTSSSTTAPIASTCRPTRRSVPTRQALKQFYVRDSAGQMVPLESVVRGCGNDGAAGDQPLQSVPVGDDQRVGRAGGQLRPGAAGNGEHRRAGRCRRDGLRVVGHLARGDQGRPAVVRHLRTGAAAGLPDARGAVREPGAAVHRPARRSARRARGARCAVDARTCRTMSTARSGWSC